MQLEWRGLTAQNITIGREGTQLKVEEGRREMDGYGKTAKWKRDGREIDKGCDGEKHKGRKRRLMKKGV